MALIKNVPAVAAQQQRLANLAAAGSGAGSGGGGDGVFMRVDDRTGKCTMGQEQSPVPLEYRWAVGLHTFKHGYKMFEAKKVTQVQMVPMAEQPAKPTPPVPYVAFPKDGPRDTLEIVLSCVDEPGLEVTFSTFSVSSQNRIAKLLREIVAHGATDAGQRGYLHPVIKVVPRKYYNNNPNVQRDIWHFDYDIVDWTDGAGLWSEAGAAAALPDPNEDAPWGDDGEEMTEAERELFEGVA